MPPLLSMVNSGGVRASLIATAGDDPTTAQLRFRVVAPGLPPREEAFGPEGKTNGTEILDLIDGLRTLLETQGFTEAKEEQHGVQ
jgi:hypothetical protein